MMHFSCSGKSDKGYVTPLPEERLSLPKGQFCLILCPQTNSSWLTYSSLPPFSFYMLSLLLHSSGKSNVHTLCYTLYINCLGPQDPSTEVRVHFQSACCSHPSGPWPKPLCVDMPVRR